MAKIEKVAPTLDNILKYGIRCTDDVRYKIALMRAREILAIRGGQRSPYWIDDECTSKILNLEMYQCAHVDGQRIRMGDLDVYIVTNCSYPVMNDYGYKSYSYRIIKPRITIVPSGNYRSGRRTVVSFTKLKKYLKTCMIGRIDDTKQLAERKLKIRDGWNESTRYATNGEAAILLDNDKEWRKVTAYDPLVSLW